MAYSDNSVQGDKSFSTMQEEAIRRVREMQRRSRSIVGAEDTTTFQPPPTQAQTQSRPVQQSSSSQSQSKPASSLLGGLLGGKDGTPFDLGGVKIDEEKALIGMLIYILYKQGADIKLLLALGYLLL
ncbi:hypothetical protein [Ruminococcus sp.]|uniref:hypothetical protein n=1 Tax=Ruminococcus sp. TaxID=41978 RepID=UPI0025E95F7D|nr:hypothetical protein [Ruminococcus sp.]